MTTLTDRYVAAVLRSVPEKTRGEIERELRASIGDALDARLAKGEARESAESAVLTDLGDPGKLAAEYSGRPQYLIGPAIFDAYVRTLGLALAFLVPVTWAAFLAIWVAGGASLPSAVVTASLAAVFVALLVAFMTTAAYAAVDRCATEPELAELAAAIGKPGKWTPERLPASAAIRPIRVGDAVEQIVGGSIGIALIFVQRSVSPFSDAQGNAIPILNPDLWSFWLPALVAIAAAWILAEFAMLARGSWSPGIAGLITLISLASAAAYIHLLASGQLFNPAFFDKLGIRGWIEPGSLLILVMILLAVVDAGTRTAKLWGVPIGKGPGRR